MIAVRPQTSCCTLQEDGHIWLVLPFVNGGSAESILTERHPKVQFVPKSTSDYAGSQLQTSQIARFQMAEEQVGRRKQRAAHVSSALLQGLSEAPIVGIVFPVLQVLSFMHELSLMHRDVKVCFHEGRSH